MLFELRTAGIDVAPAWRPVRDLFVDGHATAARKLTAGDSALPSPAAAEEFLLLVEIARACGEHRRSQALIRLARRAFPNHLMIQLYEARSLLTRERHWPAIRLLEDGWEALSAEVSAAGDGQADSDRNIRAHWATQLASVYGDAGFDASSRRWLAIAEQLPGADSALSLYSRASAHHGMREWDEAIRLTKACVTAAPGWVRAHAFHINCLLAQGLIEDAQVAIAHARKLGYRDSILDITVAAMAFSLGEFDRAESLFRLFLEDWPDADAGRWVRRSLCILLAELGRADEARAIAAGEEERLALPPLPEQSAGRHGFIPLPLIAQHRNECVPTSVAMCLWPHGRRLEPSRLFREMHGRDGVALWRMREWGRRNDCHVVPVDLTVEAITRMLDLGIPLIGVLEGALNSHVEVICGYHEDLDVLYVRDPMHWVPMAYPSQLALQRYELHGAVLAFIPEQNAEALAAAEEHPGADCSALLDLAEAVAGGDRLSAEAAYARISDDSRVAFLRSGYARNVVISPAQFHDQMTAFAADEQAAPTVRFRALLAMGGDDAEQAIEQLLAADDDWLGSIGRCHLQLLQFMQRGEWGRAGELADRLLMTSGAVSEFWSLKSDLLAELGDLPGSTEALERAIELEPQRLSLRQKSLDRRASQLTFSDYLAEFDELLARDPDEKHLLWGRVMALQDGPDGRLFEQSVREYLRWFPRDPAAYLTLRHWLLVQSREDLADAVLQEARELLPDVFEPEDSPAGPASDVSGTDLVLPREAGTVVYGDGVAADGEGVSAEVLKQLHEDSEPAELPDGHAELLDVAWAVEDPRREAALDRLMELEADGRLGWYERARLVACRLILHTGANHLSAADVAELLPDSPPGAAHWFAGAVADLVTDYEPALAVARSVSDWMERIVPNFRSYVELWFNRVLLIERSGDIEQALRELKQLLESYPAYSSALYRMGVVEYRQQDYPGAAAFLRRALQVNAGLPGAMHALRAVCEDTHDVAGALECIRMLRRKFPYDFSYLKDEVLAVAEAESPAAARDLLTGADGGFPVERLKLLQVRLDSDSDMPDVAAERLAEITVSPDTTDDDLFEDWIAQRLHLAMRREDQSEILAACEDGLRRWPDSTRLKELRADTLAHSDPNQARQLLRDVLCSGEPEARTVWQYLQIADAAPDRAAREVLIDAPQERRQDLAELIAQVMADAELLRWNADYLEWAYREFPESDAIRWRLAMHCSMNGQARRAVAVARELHDRNPDDPEAKRMLGRCLIDRNAKEALPYLEQVCEQNRSADFLFDLARCCQVAGHNHRSRDLHWEILDQNPYASASWTNLFLLGEPHARLWPHVDQFLKHGNGVDDEYCLVAVVQIALSLGKQVPVEWFPLAAQRIRVLQTHPGFRDERPRLRKAVQAWLRSRPADAAMPAADTLKAGLFERLSARLIWPRSAWIPAP